MEKPHCHQPFTMPCSDGLSEALTAEPTALLKLPDDLLFRVLSKLALQDPSSLLVAACACKAFHTIATDPQSPLWKEAFYGPLRQPPDTPEAKALEEAVQSFGGYRRLVRARWSKRTSDSQQDDHWDSKCPAEVEPGAETSFLFLVRTLKGRLMLWGVGVEEVSEFDSRARYVPILSVKASLHPLLQKEHMEEEVAKVCQPYCASNCSDTRSVRGLDSSFEVNIESELGAITWKALSLETYVSLQDGLQSRRLAPLHKNNSVTLEGLNVEDLRESEARFSAREILGWSSGPQHKEQVTIDAWVEGDMGHATGVKNEGRPPMMILENLSAGIATTCKVYKKSSTLTSFRRIPLSENRKRVLSWLKWERIIEEKYS
jgi:hypothetical protein